MAEDALLQEADKVFFGELDFNDDGLVTFEDID